MAESNFGSALSHLLVSEGGFVNNPHDPGGATNHGVTQHVYDNFRLARGLSTRSVRFIDDNEVEAIYRTLYWNPVKGDQLPAGVDYCVFDFAVNSGAHHAAEALQHAAGVNPDGAIGSVTLATVNAADPLRLVHLVCAERLAFMKQCKGWPYFHNGWSNRVAEVEQIARGMA